MRGVLFIEQIHRQFEFVLGDAPGTLAQMCGLREVGANEKFRRSMGGNVEESAVIGQQGFKLADRSAWTRTLVSMATGISKHFAGLLHGGG